MPQVVFLEFGAVLATCPFSHHQCCKKICRCKDSFA